MLKESFKIAQSDENLLSANYLIKFQPQFKPLNQGLQIVLGWWITKCGNSGLQNVLSAGLQSAFEITKCGWVDYKMRQGLQSVAGLQSELVYKIPKYIDNSSNHMRMLLIQL